MSNILRYACILLGTLWGASVFAAPSAAEVKGRCDSDRNGVVSGPELKACGKTELLVRCDTNGDGALDASESESCKTALHAVGQARAAGVRTACDTDGNGTVSKEERRACASARTVKHDH